MRRPLRLHTRKCIRFPHAVQVWSSAHLITLAVARDIAHGIRHLPLRTVRIAAEAAITAHLHAEIFDARRGLEAEVVARLNCPWPRWFRIGIVGVFAVP